MNYLDLLQKFRSEVPPPDETVVANAYRAMLKGETPRKLPALPRRRVRRWGYAAAIGAAALAIAVAAPSIFPGGKAGHQGVTAGSTTATRNLHHIALVAAHEDAQSNPPGPGQFVYTKTQGTS